MIYAANNRASADRQGLLDRVESFLDLVDTRKIFDLTDADQSARLRRLVRDAVYQLLFVERPFLVARKGGAWPYAVFRNRLAFFESMADKAAADGFWQRQAMLYLSILPFPGQWRWLHRAIEQMPSEPELVHLLSKERQKRRSKLAAKKKKQFKIEHFCQVLKKPYLPARKGILRVYALPYLLDQADLLARIRKEYLLYIEPPWGVVYRHSWCRIFSGGEDPCLFGMADPDDRQFLNSQPSIRAISLAHGDFLEDHTPSASSHRDYDIVFNSSFDSMVPKRHGRMLALLRDDRLCGTRALFLGRGSEKNIALFKQTAAQMGLAKRIRVISNLERDQVGKQLSRCRMGVHLSLHENGGRVVYEYFRADLPCVLSACTTGINPEIFNPLTGHRVDDDHLAEAIADVLKNRKRYRPRRWYLEHSGSRNNTHVLEQYFKKVFAELGYDWGGSIPELTGGGSFRYASRDDFERFWHQYQILSHCFQRHWPDLFEPMLNSPACENA